MRTLNFTAALVATLFLVACAADSGTAGDSSGTGVTLCPNIDDMGTGAEGQTCSVSSNCMCGLFCKAAPVVTQCPNIGDMGTGVEGETCFGGPSDCMCGLFCKDSVCMPYEGDYADCSCAPDSATAERVCVPYEGSYTDCSCVRDVAGADTTVAPEPDVIVTPDVVVTPDVDLVSDVQGPEVDAVEDDVVLQDTVVSGDVVETEDVEDPEDVPPDDRFFEQMVTGLSSDFVFKGAFAA
ncbi:MAG: hypothetical protein QF464_22795, partial [Myxococcota bacterium]|nr:hypothetical protein [Myxococcota bacterium]